MSERLTDEQLDWRAHSPMVRIAAEELVALRARVAKLEAALLMFTRHPVVPIKDGDGIPAAVVPIVWLDNARAVLKDAPQ